MGPGPPTFWALEITKKTKIQKVGNSKMKIVNEGFGTGVYISPFAPQNEGEQF